jgi:hypothetical protein
VINKYISELFIFPIVFHVAYESDKLFDNMYNVECGTEYIYSANTQRSAYIQQNIGIKNSKIAIINDPGNIVICTKKYIVVISKSNFSNAIYYKNTGNLVERPNIFGKRDKLLHPAYLCDVERLRAVFNDMFTTVNTPIPAILPP